MESENRTCQSCGGVVAAGNRFCPSCGFETLDTRARPADTVVDDATVISHGSLERITSDRLTAATTGEFEVLERIGHGAMGSVYLARDLALSRRVAIKVISPQLLSDEAMVARFRLEAQTVAALRHPNIVNLYGVRQLGDLHYFIMDFIDGPSLRALMKAHSPLDIAVAQALLFQAGSALSYAHRRGRGVIHRDVKPANIMVDREGHAVVMDFGISKVGQTQSGLTQTGATIGTPEYMSPEQCMDQELTGASDQYALGIVAYEMLTGAVPFKGSTYAIMMAHASTPVPAIREKRPDCPSDVEAAVMRMLAKSPQDRWPDLDEAVTALGGKPLSHGDPVRDTIIALAESVSSDFVGLDASSPLSPVPGAPEPASITITGLPDVVEPGDRFELQVEARRSSGATLPPSNTDWSTSDPTVASVVDGTVVALVPGSASLTATVGAVASTVILSVRERRSAGVSVRPQTVLIEAGGIIPLHADVLDRRGDPLEGPVEWVSQDESIATVSTDGRVTAVGPGKTQITAMSDGVTGIAHIEVEQAAVGEITISGTVDEVRVGDDLSLEVVVTDTRGAPLGAAAVAWTSEHAKVVALREGRLVAVGTGTATIRAESGGRSTTVDVKVAPAAVVSIRISGVPDAPGPGDEFTLVALLLDQGRIPIVREVSWRSSDPSIATVSDAGLVTVEAAGSVDITARSGDVDESVRLEIRSPGAAAAAAPVAAATPVPSGSNRRNQALIGVAAVIVILLGLAKTFGGGGDVALEGKAAVTLATVADTLTASDSLRLFASVRGADGVALDDASLIWTSSDPAVATVDATGLVVARAGGSTTISAAFEGISAATDLWVRPTTTVAVAEPEQPAVTPAAGSAAADNRPAATQPDQPESGDQPPDDDPPSEDDAAVASVRIEGGDRMLAVGGSASLTATAMNSSGESVEASSVEWRSSNEQVATARGGLLVGTGRGRAMISATVAGVEGRIGVRVEPRVEQPSARDEALARVVPTREEATAEVQKFVNLLRSANAEAVGRLLGRSGRARAQEIVAQMRQSNFNARLMRLGDPKLTPDGAEVDFDLELASRGAVGALNRRTVTFLAALQPTQDGWMLAGVSRPPG